ncbi:hypothetical protein GOBAR_AA10269 [Gossypium barbadense]|uniref:Uncharacterized protein n=1 Tax=Gossypium barbadense TaxID=3634 RepID=A0A2P5Y441_GOSBA|nr:hypothetical protein GOBAR_AA10269 [Gossypium barbadense]
MELVDDEDVETMIALYFGDRSDQNAPIQLFAELAGVEPTKDLIALDPNVAHAAEFPKYPEILPTQRLAIDSKRPSIVDPVYHLALMELISKIDGAIAGGLKHFIIHENEFPVLLDLSTWEVPPTTFELVPDKGLRRNLKGHLQSSRIHNEMDIREKFDGKHCGLCRLAGHNRSKCPQQNYHIVQSSQSGRN